MENNESVKVKSILLEFMRSTKKCIKNNRNSKNIIIKLVIEILYSIRILLSSLKKSCLDKQFRAIVYMKIFKSNQIHQTTSTTFMDRYPKIFLACSDYFNNRENIKILSYGCSTGEEVLTLRKYFPSATIIGAEINKHSLEICKKLSVDDKIIFINSTPSEIIKQGKFDAIFCMAVLQRTPHLVTEQGITSLAKIYPVDRFEEQIVELDEYINQEGLMVIHFTQYSFIDTNVSSKYKPLGDYNQDNYRSSVFDKNSNLIKEPTSQKSIFIKVKN